MRAFASKEKSNQLDARPLTLPRPRGPAPGPTGETGSLILHLQRTIGNQAVQRLLHTNADTAPYKQPIGTPGDIHEQEADRAAAQVTDRGRTGEHGEVESGDQSLSLKDRAFFEPRLGHDFSRVRIHTDARSAALADALNAEAFTVGRDIYFGAGKQQSRSTESDQLLAHELAHVKQQSRTGPALQPKLKLTGSAGNVSRVVALLNSGLRGYRTSADNAGNISIVQNFVEQAPDAQQQALADRLTNIINDPQNVTMTVSAGSKTIVGSYATGDIDIADIEAIGVGALIHEIEEQYQKQVKSVAYGSETTGAHGEGIKAESEVTGAKRGAQRVVSSKTNADGTVDAVIEIPFTWPDGSVKTQVMTLKNNDVVSVTWK